PDDAALGRRVRRLADLALVGGDGGRIDDDAALLADGRLPGHPRRGEADHVEGADQVDRDHAGEGVEREGAVAADGAPRRADAGTIDEDAGDAVTRLGGGDRFGGLLT